MADPVSIPLTPDQRELVAAFERESKVALQNRAAAITAILLQTHTLDQVRGAATQIVDGTLVFTPNA